MASQFADKTIEQVVGSVFGLCRDQYGCRFLQKKLDERDAKALSIIFEETHERFAELMTDPFGNYLCQKLLEHCDAQQRLLLIRNVSPQLVRISTNMHGTRAVQKMIEFVSTPEQVELVKLALKDNVVTLIQDLNGNHVVQRCLHRLTHGDNQFIYDAVAMHCIEVATHRHGCCVLQRCIDHASESQKKQLVDTIERLSLRLVRDPYGNYVVQYMLDLPYQNTADKVCSRFRGNLRDLSTEKFSSNVIEKCLKVCNDQTREWMVDEVMSEDTLSALLQDAYGNYVVQTSLNVSSPAQHRRLVDAIRPHLPQLRNTPYGKRIQNKIMKELSSPGDRQQGGGGDRQQGGRHHGGGHHRQSQQRGNRRYY
jgi:Pumilio-family RNA binding repeat